MATQNSGKFRVFESHLFNQPLCLHMYFQVFRQVEHISFPCSTSSQRWPALGKLPISRGPAQERVHWLQPLRPL